MSNYRLDIDESAIYDGDIRVLKLDTGGGVGNYSNDNWRAATALGTRIVELLKYANGGQWAEVARIAEAPAVHEALTAFSHDATGDNGAMVVRAVLEAAAAGVPPIDQTEPKGGA